MQHSWRVEFIKDHKIQVTFVAAYNDSDAIIRVVQEFGEVEILEVTNG